MGIYTIVSSIPGNYPGFAFADKVYYADIVDSDSILQIAKEEKIDGIVTCGSDIAVKTIGYICDTLHLKGVSEGAASITCNKISMKLALTEGGVNTAKYKIADINDSRENILDKCNHIGYPVVFKAVDSSGSRGITVVYTEKEIDFAIGNIKNVTRSPKYLIEEFLNGIELGADAFIYNGKIQFVIPHGKTVYYANTGIPVGHYIPYEDDTISKDVISQVEMAIKAIGLNNCAVNTDIMLHNGIPYILEIGARVGATMIPEHISLYQGYNYYEKIIEASFGMDVDFSPTEYGKICSASKLIFSKEGGILKRYLNLPSSRVIDTDDYNTFGNSECGIYSIQIDKLAGDEIREFMTGPDRIGHIITYGKTLNIAKSTLENVSKNITIELENIN